MSEPMDTPFEGIYETFKIDNPHLYRQGASNDTREEVELPELPQSVLMRMRNNNNSGHYLEATQEALYGRERQLKAALSANRGLQNVNDSLTRTVAAAIERASKAEAANREKDAEIADLRKSLIQAGREAGAFLTDEVSTEFLRHVPEGIRLKFASLRASSGEKPEDAYRRGWMEGMMAEAHAESGVSPEVDPESFIINGIDMVPPYVAPPSLPTEKEK